MSIKHKRKSRDKKREKFVKEEKKNGFEFKPTYIAGLLVIVGISYLMFFSGQEVEPLPPPGNSAGESEDTNKISKTEQSNIEQSNIEQSNIEQSNIDSAPPESKIMTVRIEIEAMTCGGCPNKIKRYALSGLNGVKKYDVYLTTPGKGEAVVEYDPNIITSGEIVDAIMKLEYPATVISNE